MTSWKKEEIEIADGTKVLAQMPVIVSASRSTDIPAFYSDWFMERLNAGYVKWFNPFNGVPLYVGFKKMRCIVFWSKNPRPMLAHLDALDAICPNYYFQFTLNDYDAERIEPRVPPLDERVETFKRLSERVGKDRVVWRFDPLILTDKLSVSDILAKVERLGDQVAQYTSQLVFSFIDINAYKKVGGNLRNGGVNAREFTPDEMCTVVQRIGCADAGHVFDAERRKIAQTFCPCFHSSCRFDILLLAMLRQSFTDFIFATNTDGSGKTASYVRALDIFQLARMEASCRGVFDEMRGMT